MKKLTESQRKELNRLRKIERDYQRDRKKFFTEIDENIDDVITYLTERGYTIVEPDAVGKEKGTDGGKADDAEGGFSSLLNGDDADTADDSEEPFHYFRDGAK